MNTKNVKNIKETFLPGTIIRCLSMDDKQAIPSGTLGVVTHVDDMGTIHMVWTTGSTLGLIVGEDVFEVMHGADFELLRTCSENKYLFSRTRICEIMISSILARVLKKYYPIKVVFEDDAFWWGVSLVNTPFSFSIEDVRLLIEYASGSEAEKENFLSEIPELPDTSTRSLGKELLEKIIRKNISKLKTIHPVVGQGLLFEFERRE